LPTEDEVIFRVSRTSERIVGALQPGDELVEALTRVCQENGVIAGEVRGVGSFDAIELVAFDERTGTYRTIVDDDGSFELVNLNGNVSRLGEETVLRLEALFNVLGPLGPQLVGGQLRRARAIQAEFVIDSFTDLTLERRLDPSTKRLVLDRIERIPSAVAEKTAEKPREAPSEEAPAEPSMSWAEAIAETERVDNARSARRDGALKKDKTVKKTSKSLYEDLDFDEPLMTPGDLLDHPKLGRCRVMRVEDDTYAHIRLPRGRIRKLALEILEISFKGEEAGSRIFEARVRR
jgi:predicted DNA-binding protein with PD1-like motif